MPDHAEVMKARPLQMGLAVGTLGPERPDYSLAVIIVLAILTLAGALALLPSAEEKAAALIARERYVEAIALLEQRDGQNLLNSYEAFSLTRLYRLTGSDSKATNLLERTLERAPDSRWARDELIEIYRSEGRHEEEARLLQQVFSASPDKPSFKRLLGLYRLDADRDSERTLLVEADAAGLASQPERRRLNWLQVNGSGTSAGALWRAADAATQNRARRDLVDLAAAAETIQTSANLFSVREIVQ
jgi:tetratricopeptide (TPR) repeat protein